MAAGEQRVTGEPEVSSIWQGGGLTVRVLEIWDDGPPVVRVERLVDNGKLLARPARGGVIPLASFQAGGGMQPFDPTGDDQWTRVIRARYLA